MDSVLDGLAAPTAQTVTDFPPGETPARYLPSGDIATMDSGGGACAWDGGTAGELAGTDLQDWLTAAAPVRSKAGTTWPTKPVVTCASAAHRDQACPPAT